MLKTKMISLMKHQRDRMDNLMPQSERVQLINVLKSTGATHLDCTTVIGHPNFLAHTTAWITDIRAAGLKVTWRNDHINLKGLYGQPAFVGANRKPTQFWIDEGVKAAQALGNLVAAGDEWAIYIEQTEGIFQDATAFMFAGLPDTYAQFFIALHTACKAVLPTGVTVGLSTNNGSELLTRWMPRALSDFAGVVVIDHYKDGDVAGYEADIRTVSQNYGKPVYIQEGAPHRFAKPTRAEADAYFAVNKKLADEGILVGYGSWSGWASTNESIVDLVNGKFVLNEQGQSLAAWWGGVAPVPQPTPTDEKIVGIYGTSTTLVVTNKGNLWKLSNGKWSKVTLPDFTV